MSDVSLTYILVTRNKIDYLKYTLAKLFENKLDNEEIIIIDGKSTDGTSEYLKEIYSSHNSPIDRLISETDYGEAHAFNKGIFLANGELIKFIADDDVFYYPSIQAAKKFMITHSHIDLTFGITYNVKYGNFDSIVCQHDVESRYAEYIKSQKPFSFTGLSLMVRKTAFARLGLFSVNTCAPDTEFSLRITSLKSELKYIQLPVVVRVENPSSNYNRKTKYKFAKEGIKLLYQYQSISYFRYHIYRLKEVIKLSIRNWIQPGKNKTVVKNNSVIIDYTFFSKVEAYLEREFITFQAKSIGTLE